MNNDKFKIVVRVDIVPEGIEPPPLILKGLPPVVNFELGAEHMPHGVNFSGIDIALGKHPEPVNDLISHVLGMLPGAFTDCLQDSPERVWHSEKREYDAHGNFTVTGQKRTFDA